MANKKQRNLRSIEMASEGTDFGRRSAEQPGVPPPYRSASPEAEERMRFFLREIGQGPRTGRDLTREEAREAMSLILSQQARAGGHGAGVMALHA